MDFTREPIIETIVTPREGYKLVVRSSKAAGQEEFFVDSVEIVSFGHSLFFRSIERPRPFLVPVSDYEILEAREAKMVLKSTTSDRSIKIGGGKEAAPKIHKEIEKESVSIDAQSKAEGVSDNVETHRNEKKRERRRQYRKRRGGREEGDKEEGADAATEGQVAKESIVNDLTIGMEGEQVAPSVTSTLFSSLLQPPPQLISETIGQYRGNDLFKSAFFLKDEEQYKPHDKAEELLKGEIEDFEIAVPIQQENESTSEQLVESSEEGTMPLHTDEEENKQETDFPF